MPTRRWIGPRALQAAGALLLLLAAPLAGQTPATIRIAPGPNLRVLSGEYNEVWLAGNSELLIAVGQIGAGVGAGQRGATTAMSRDGGYTWAPVQLPGYGPGAFDPMAVMGADGRIHVMQAIIGGTFAAQIGGDGSVTPTVRMWSTSDGWQWTGPGELKAPVPPDHPRMVADLTGGPHHGRLYVAWNDVADQFLPDRYEMFLQYSDDDGRTFSPPLLVDQRGGGKLVATEPVVLSDGTLLVTHYQYWNPLVDVRNARMPFFVSRSLDGGETFTPPESVFEFGPHVWFERQGEFARAFTLPIVAADTSSASPYRDHIYVVWDDVSSGQSDIFLTRSTDGGASWSTPLRVNDNDPISPLGVADYRMTPTVAVSPDGTIGITWYDRRGDPARRCWDLYFAVSTDGGATVSRNIPVTTAQSCPAASDAPAVVVHNRSEHLDRNRPPDSLIARMSLIERLGVTVADEVRAARAASTRDLENGRLRVSFDPGRNTWPGHYSGLIADHDGVFRALWLDRRNGSQEMFTTRIVVGGAAPQPAGLRALEITDRVEVVAGAPTYDAAAGTVRFKLQIRNVSDAPIHGPITLRVVGEAAGLSAVPDDVADAGLDFTGRLGTDDLLLPGGLSEPVDLTVRTSAEAGFDVAFDFKVFGRIR